MKFLYFIMFFCFSASSVLPGPKPSIISLMEVKTSSQGRFSSSSEPSPAVSTLSTETKTISHAATKMKDTTVVIIVSVSLALLVCALIPFVFYGYCRTNTNDQNRPEANKSEEVCFEEKTGVSSTQTSVRLQASDPESSNQDASQFASVHQALDPINQD
ncbi:CMRF35-like molecule 6 [Xyrichtys novacula]|uniref:CMRF35-like molecule 6 n=1 Tax=Xyrichtys novacula TaxID=13765 RepID=A0AAV1EWM9_XYRNO|nr:CMRF35-like molecule 6 [Xyrichtys novacula]